MKHNEYDTILYVEIPWRQNNKSEADLQAEVIASKGEATEWEDHWDFGPGRIRDLEINLEKIYE